MDPSPWFPRLLHFSELNRRRRSRGISGGPLNNQRATLLKRCNFRHELARSYSRHYAQHLHCIVIRKIPIVRLSYPSTRRRCNEQRPSFLFSPGYTPRFVSKFSASKFLGKKKKKNSLNSILSRLVEPRRVSLETSSAKHGRHMR